MSKVATLLITSLLLIIACKEQHQPKPVNSENTELAFEAEKAAILQTLNGETEAAFSRNYDAWQDKWVHDPAMTKVYLNFVDSTFSESIGWAEVDQFVKDYFEAHPEPEPIPELVDDIELRLYGNGAWVVFEQQDSLRGLKRETRLMEKVDDQWKIAGMQTTIYGVRAKEQVTDAKD